MCLLELFYLFSRQSCNLRNSINRDIERFQLTGSDCFFFFDTEKVIRHFRTALQHLEKGGFDLSISKWTELVSLRTKEDTE